MKAFADKFRTQLTTQLPPLSTERATNTSKLLGSNPRRAMEYARGVRSAMKKDQTELQADVKDRENDDNVETLYHWRAWQILAL